VTFEEGGDVRWILQWQRVDDEPVEEDVVCRRVI
jgi:hypothetical protein